MIELPDGEVISAAEHAANIVEGRGETTYNGVTRVISIRIPLHLMADLQALANKSGKTRNATISTLLEVGLEEVRRHLEPETIQELNEITTEVYSDLAAEVV